MTDFRPSAPATAAEVKRMVCALNDSMNSKTHQTLIDNIVATGASVAEVLEAYSWVARGEDLEAEDEQPRGRVGLVHALLTKKPRAANDDQHRSRPVVIPSAPSRSSSLASRF